MQAKLIRSSGVVLIVRVLGAFFQMASVALVVLFFDPEHVGLYGILWSAALIARVAGPAGIDLTGMKTQAILWASGRQADAHRSARRDLITVAKLWLGLAVPTAGIGFYLMIAFPDYLEILIVGYVVCFMSSLQRLFLVQMRVSDRIISSQLLESLLLPSLAALAVLATGLFARDFLLAGQAFAFCLVTLVYYYMSPGRAEKTLLGGAPVERPWGETIAMASGTVLTALSVRAPIFVVGTGSLAAAGTFEIAQRIQSAGSLGISAVGSVYMPAVRVALHKRDRKKLLTLIATSSALSLIIPTLLLSSLILLGEGIVEAWLGSGYEGLWLASVYLLLAAVLNAATGTLSTLLTMGGHEKIFAAICAAQLGVFVSLVAGFGISGSSEMALAVLVGEVIRSGLLVLMSAVVFPRTSRWEKNLLATAGTESGT